MVVEERVFTGKQERNNEEIKRQTQTIRERRKKINIEHKNLFLSLHTNKPNKHENIGYKKLHEPTNYNKRKKHCKNTTSQHMQ